ncbi:MAG: cell division protein FtsQ/DivIB [bacterium]
MSSGVGPKNTSKRDSEEWRISRWFKGVLPERFYLKESLIILVALMVGYFAYDFSQYLLNGEKFQVRVKIDGLEALSRESVLDSIQDRVGTADRPKSLLQVSVQDVRSKLLTEIPRLKTVRVRKDYPDVLRITVTERRPVALLARKNRGNDETVYLPVDREGVVFRPTQEEVEKLPGTVPVVKGFPQLDQGSTSFKRRWKKALNVIDSVRKRFSGHLLDWVQVRPGGYVKIRINHPKKLNVRLGEAQYGKKLDKLKQMMQTNQFLDIKKYVNLSEINNVRVR